MSAVAMSGARAFWTLLKRDLRLAIRSSGETLNPLFFYLLVITLFPLGISPEPETLARLAGGGIWIGALLAVLLSMGAMFRADHADGTLEFLLLSPHPLSMLVLAKVVAHWLTTGLILMLMAPLAGLLLHLPGHSFPPLILGLLLGTPLMSLIGGIGAALTARMDRGGLLLTLLSLPLYFPVLIFGTGAVQESLDGLSYNGHLLWMAAMLVLALSLAPLAIAASLRAVSDG